MIEQMFAVLAWIVLAILAALFGAILIAVIVGLVIAVIRTVRDERKGKNE